MKHINYYIRYLERECSKYVNSIRMPTENLEASKFKQLFNLTLPKLLYIVLQWPKN